LRGDLAGKVAIVTGSTQGVGEAIAHRIVEWGGAGIVVTGRNTRRGAAVARAIEAQGARAVFVAADAGDPEAAATIAAACHSAFGRCDLLVNAAANTERAGVLDAEAGFIDAMFAANVRTPLLLMQAAARMMREQGQGGAMVNILSMNAHCGAPDLAVYSASKGAMATLTRNAANTLASDRIRVNGINLGWADTPAEHVVQEKVSPHGKNWLEEANRTRPFGRLIQVDEIADLAAFLLSANAGVMTGALIDYEQWVLGAPRN
jgi:NAD(P)-dependent dehydrogenase (short-subunit alcohol dehydrogenase family)